MNTRRISGLMPVVMVLALSIASPASGQSVAPGASADPLAPAWVTGTIQLAPSCDNPPMVMSDGVGQYRGVRCGPQTWVTSDPRLSGSAVASWNLDSYFGVPGTATGTVSVWSAAYEVTNDAGSWSCWDTAGLSLGPGTSATPVNPEALTCEGAGAYDGLMAILVLPETDRTISGLIFPGETPPIP